MHQKEAEKKRQVNRSKYSGEPCAPMDVEEAKLRFLKAANDFSPLAIVRKRPFVSLGTAFIAGFGISSIGGSKTAPPTIAMIAQIAGIAAQLMPFILSRARGSDG